jgi:uncharacterized membrane protein
MMKSRAWAPIGVALGAAAVVAVALAFAGPSWLVANARVVACYDAGVIAMLAWHWKTVLRTGPSRTKEWAAAEDPGRDALFVVTLIAVAFGFVAAFSILGRGPHDRIPQHEAFLYTVGLAAVVLGWGLIHTVFLFRYAHLYYRDRNSDKESVRALTFPGTIEPSYMDLAYFSFVVGMTFQVSDVQITSAGIRRLVLVHGLISFAYNTAILALVVNVVSGLLHS